MMDSDLLELPLGVKIYVHPRTKPVFCRGKLGETLQLPCLYFTLDDPYNHHLNIDYNCLHDPHLRDYHKRKDVLKLLKRRGFVTSDNKVVCTLKEFNEYRQYVTRHKLRAEHMSTRKEEWVHPPPLKSKHGPKPPGDTNTSRPAELFVVAQKPSYPPQHKRTLRFEQEDAELPSRDSTDSDSQTMADITADGCVKAVLGQLSAAEVQKLRELAEIVVLRVFGKLKVPRDQRASFLRRAAQGIRRSSGSCMGAEPLETPQDHQRHMELVAQELVATVLDTLAQYLESRPSEAAAAARQEEQPVDADIAKEGETASLGSARLEACLDKLSRLVVQNVRNLLKSMIASQFERDSSGEYTEVLELPNGHVSDRQPRPPQTLSSKQGTGARRGFPRASEHQRLEARTGAKLPLLYQKRPARRTSYARTLEPEVLETVEESLEEEGSATTSGNTQDLNHMAKQVIHSAIQRICPCGHAPTSEEDLQGSTDPPSSQGAAQGTLPSVHPRFPRQPVPPAGPKTPAQARAQRRAARPKPV